MDTKLLDRLERKTRRLVEELEKLRLENTRLTQELEDAQDAVRTMERPEADPGLGSRLRVLEEERVAVRGRVEKLVSLLEEAT